MNSDSGDRESASERASAAPLEDPFRAARAWRDRHAPELIGEADGLLEVFAQLAQVADSDCSLLVQGETGTGKELIARAVHRASRRADAPFISVNCGAIPENLMESELFGHARGAFTGAVQARTGSFAAADTGTLFLDEIGELPLTQQAKLLRVLQTREVVPVGETRGRRVDIRLIAATHRDLEAMVADGAFREDLLYRIQVVAVELPPLRRRPGDVRLLIDHFIRKTNERRSRHVEGIEPAVLERLLAAELLGNVRQLENIIEHMVLMRASGTITVDDLPPRLRGTSSRPPVDAEATLPEHGIDLRDAVERYENALILQALERAGWNKNLAAAMLQMNRSTLVEKLKRKNIQNRE